MEDAAYVPVYDEGKQMTLGDFFVEYGVTLPQLITITEGFYGRTKYDDFTNGQVLYIAGYTKQRRVLAKELQSNVKTRYFSIPIDTPYMFKVIRSHKKAEEPATLRDVIKTHDYPVMTQFAPHYSQLTISGCKENAQSFNNLLLTQEFHELFLRGHCIENGKIRSNINLMALSRNISCAVVTGIDGKTEKQFRNHLSDLEQKIAGVKLDKSAGNQELKWMSDDGRGIDIFIPDLELPQPLQEEADRTPQLPMRIRSINNDVSDDDMYEPPPVHLEPRVQPSPHPKHRIKHPQLPEIPTDTITQVRTKGSESSINFVLPKPKATEPSNLPHVCTPPVTEDEYIFSDVVDPEFDNHKEPREEYLSFSDKKPSPKPKEKPDLPKTPIPAIKKSKKNHVYENSINVVHPMTKPPEPPTQHLKGNELQMAEDEYIDSDKATPTADDMYREFENIEIGLDRPENTCMSPLPEPDVFSRTRCEGSVKSTPRPWLDDLKVCDVGVVLKQLKLGRYVDKFAEDRVSGSILGEYDEEILKDEYNFGKIETIRLMKFINSGHIPQ